MATLGVTTAVRKHQDNILSLLCSSTNTPTILDSKIGRLRVDKVALMTSATIGMQQASGTQFLLKRLYEIAHKEEKEVHQLLPRKL
jgi:hypothetical protein